MCQQKMAGDVPCVPGRQQRTCVVIPSIPRFSFLRTPRSVQSENGNPLFYLKLGSLAVPHRKGDSLSRQQLVPSLITVRQEPKHGCQLRTPFACQTSDQQYFSIRHTRSHEQERLNVSLCGNESWFYRSCHGGCVTGDLKAARTSVLVLLEGGQRAPEEKALSLIPNQPPFSAWRQSEEPRGPCEQRAGYASCLCRKGLQTRRPWSEESR